MTVGDALALVESHAASFLGPVRGRASTSFLGAEPVEVLRFGPDPAGLVRYLTLGMSRAPMADPAATVVPEAGPRAELLLSLHRACDGVARALAVLAASPSVEGLLVLPGAGLDLGQPLWDGAGFQAVLVGEPGGLVPDLAPDGVQFLPVFPMTPSEAAWKRVHGASALEQLWLAQELDLRDPERRPAALPAR